MCRVAGGARGDKVKAELLSDDRRKVNDVSECLCESGAQCSDGFGVECGLLLGATG